MKYISTKDGKIYKTLEDYMQSDLPPSKMRVEDVTKGWHVIISKNKVIKQRDTINLLCDRFVVDFENGEEPIAFKNYLDALNYFGKAKIYGAVWCDRGLIYAAETNEKGELELI